MEVYIVDGNSNGEFRLDVDEGGPLLTVIAELDREKYAMNNIILMNGADGQQLGKHSSFALHTVIVAAKDKGLPPRIGKAQVNILINDINDTPPRFDKEGGYIEFLAEDVKPGTQVCQTTATDADSYEKTQLTYNFGKNTPNIPFKIDPITGIVNVSRPLDISEAEQYSLVVDVFDGLWKSSTNLKIFISK